MSEFALPSGWVSARLGDLYNFEYGKSLIKGARTENGKFPVYGSSGIVGMHDEFLVEGPAIIVGRKGAAGSVSYSPDNLWPIDTTYFVRGDNNLYLKFSYYLFKSLNFAKLEASTAIPGLNRNHAYDETVLLPPINEQHRIVAKIEELFSELDKGIENLKTAREQIKVYRQALLKHAFEGKLTAQWRAERRANSVSTVIPAQAGIQQDKNAFCLNPLDSRLRGNDGVSGGYDEPLETATALLARIQTEREQRYQQQLQQWQTTGGSKPKAPKPLPSLTAEELAKLPEGWIALCVENLFEIEDGDRGEHYPTKGDFSDTGYCLFLNAKNVTKRGFAFQEMSFIPEQKHLALRKGTLKRGDIVFTSRGTLGNIAHYNDSIQHEHVRINSGMFIIRNYDDFLTPDFLYYHLNAPIITGQIEKLQSGTAQPQLPIREFKSFRFVIPSKEEQQQIVQELESKLSEVDQLELTITTSLQKAEALRQSILKKAYAGQLVAQDADDEPAAALLARIKAERATDEHGSAVRQRGKRG